MVPQTWTYRHDQIQTPRPYAIDVDADDWLWEGCGSNRLTGHHLGGAQVRQLAIAEMGNRPVYQVFAVEDRLVVVLGDAPFYLVVDPRRGTAVRRPLAGPRPIVWYGLKAGGKLLLFDRASSCIAVLDGPDAEPRPVVCPWPGELASGWALSDGLVYAPLSDPARVVRFDPRTERFIDVLPLPWPEATLAGYLEHGGRLCAWDTARGRILCLELSRRQWLDPVPTPDHGSVYGFLGAGFGYQGRAYICLSTYAHPSRLDPRTGKVIIPDGPLTVDGRPPRFMERMLVWDPDAGAFDYLVAPAQPDGVPLLCYSWTDGARFAITGIVVPFDEPGVPGPQLGSWLVVQSQPAAAEPGFGPPDVNFDRAAHVAGYRRSYSRHRSLFLPHPEHSPALAAMHGAVADYPPGREAELVRRAARTDRAAYLGHLVESLTHGVDRTAERVQRLAGHLQQTLYYNPIQMPATGDPIAVLEAHDARCGQAATVTLALLEAAGIPARRRELFHHTVAEATYDGAEHIVDALFFGARQPQRDGRVLSVDELLADPYCADAYPQQCFAYDPELVTSEDGFWVLGYVFGIWGSEPYYSYYLGAPKDQPPTVPHALPTQRDGDTAVRLNWSRSLKAGGGAVEYEVRVLGERTGGEPLLCATTAETCLCWQVPQPERMYFVEIRAQDSHRRLNADTWYPAARTNFALVPADRYGWYGLL